MQDAVAEDSQYNCNPAARVSRISYRGWETGGGDEETNTRELRGEGGRGMDRTIAILLVGESNMPFFSFETR